MIKKCYNVECLSWNEFDAGYCFGKKQKTCHAFQSRNKAVDELKKTIKKIKKLK